MRTRLEKDVLKQLTFFVVSIFACKLTGGLFAWALVAYSCMAAMNGDVKKALIGFVFLPLLIFISPVLVYGPYLGPAARMGHIAILTCMLFSPRARIAPDGIPLGMLFVYLVIAVISSIDGWMPLISYLKIVNFLLFILGIRIIGKAMQASDQALYQLRVSFLSLAFFIIVGSMVTCFIPSVGYSMEIQNAAMYGSEISGADVMAREGKRLFSGVLNHSQTLAANVPLLFAWTLCDMFLIEKKVTKLHFSIIAVAPLLMYMSRSRTALLVVMIAFIMIWLLVLRKAGLPIHFKRRIASFFYFFVGILLMAAVYAQVRDKTFSRWVRKNDDVEGDTRGLVEAITETRMGLIEYNLNDFYLNPLFGKGFQVMPWHAAAYKSGRISLLSAPIEKGVLPFLVLGETGIVGFIVFTIFILRFYGECARRRYTVLMCLFTALLAANMSEAAFFSPGGGALQWTSTVIGGFCIDMIVKRQNEIFRQRRFYA